jgi:hypothetical protein
VIDYKGKGYFTGKAHSFKASVYPPLPGSAKGSSQDVPTPSTTAKYVAEGTWDTTSKLKSGAPFTDVTGPKVEIEVGPVEEMEEFETRKLWADVAKGIRSGDFDLASREKTRIEVSSKLHIVIWRCLLGNASIPLNSHMRYSLRLSRTKELATANAERRNCRWDKVGVEALRAHRYRSRM